MNMAVLKMDNHIEYVYFKKQNGTKKLKFLMILSWLFLVLYLLYVALILSGHFEKYLKHGSF